VGVLITVKVPGDVAAFRATLSGRAEELKAVAERGRSAGAIHHRFGVGPDFVLVVDEWESVEQFEAFFSSPELREFVASAGGTGAPAITVAEAVASVDQF
jgi:quinol monooxygenase YgiN